jgi:hypothetical protein
MIKASRPRHVRIYDEDWNLIEATFGRNSAKPIGTTKLIREIVHTWVERLRVKADGIGEAELRAMEEEGDE